MAETENAAGKTTPPMEVANGKTRENINDELHATLEKAGADPVLMIAESELPRLGAYYKTYRGAFVEIHDEWAWGWMVRDRDGQYVHLASSEGE